MRTGFKGKRYKGVYMVCRKINIFNINYTYLKIETWTYFSEKDV